MIAQEVVLMMKKNFMILLALELIVATLKRNIILVSNHEKIASLKLFPIG